MFELEHTISMFDSFLGVLPSAFRAIPCFQGEPLCSSRCLIDNTVPSAFNCPCSTGYLLPGLADYVISKVCLTVVSASTSPV